MPKAHVVTSGGFLLRLFSSAPTSFSTTKKLKKSLKLCRVYSDLKNLPY